MTPRSRFFGAWSGVVITLAIIAGLEGLRAAAWPLPNPPAILLLAVIFTAFRGGTGPALVSAAIAWLYVSYHFSIPGRVLTYTTENFVRVAVWAVAIPAAALLVGTLHARALRTARHHVGQRADERIAAEQARAAAAVQLSEERMRLTLGNALDAFVAMDEGGRIIEWNAQAERTFGWPRAEAVGRSLAETIVPPADRRAHAEGLRRFLSTGEGHILGRRIEISGLHRDGREFPVELSVLAYRDGGVWTFSAFIRDISDRKAAEQRQRMMMRELDHRVKNNLAAVLSILDSTLAGSDSLERFAGAFRGRVMAMARLHSALAQSRWVGADLRALVRQTLEPYAQGVEGRIVIRGDALDLPARAVPSIAMTLHELATNAAKYGALSQAGGRVEVRWSRERDPARGELLRLAWQESGGSAPVAAPARRGFGTDFIEKGIPFEMAGDVDLEFTPEGVRCELVVPISPGPAPGAGAADPPGEPRPSAPESAAPVGA